MTGVRDNAIVDVRDGPMPSAQQIAYRAVVLGYCREVRRYNATDALCYNSECA
jgi:hypothetical protein